ncbi:MAG: phosphotransferase [Candidatus Levybacteria bacterium]|nr:phosphotransferase [Candidatus Levybacteria bacterium]
MSNETSPKQLSSEFVRSAIHKLYGITSIKPPKAEGEGIENAVWIFHTERQDFIAKIFDHSDTIAKDVNEEVEIYEYLRSHDIHTPEVVPSLSGERVALITVDLPVIVMKLEKLKRISASDLSKDQLNIIATTVSKMHSVLMHYPRIEHIRPSSHDAESIYDHSMKDFDLFLTSPNAKSPYLQDHERLRKIRNDAINYLQRQKLGSDLTKSVLHNDLALGHLLFLEDGELYIFDFSDFEYGPVALDLGVLFFNFYREGEITIDQWKSMIEEFLSVYTQNVPLTENDKKAIDIFTVSRMLEHIRYLDDRSIKEGHIMDDKGIKKRYDLLEALCIRIHVKC